MTKRNFKRSTFAWTKHASKNKKIKQRDGFVKEEFMIRKGTAMRSQINLYWQKRAEEKKRYLNNIQ